MDRDEKIGYDTASNKDQIGDTIQSTSVINIVGSDERLYKINVEIVRQRWYNKYI